MKMKKNVGLADQKVRAYVLAPILALVGVVALVAGWSVWIAIVAFVLAVVMLVTGLSRTCPIYSATKLSTTAKDPAAAA